MSYRRAGGMSPETRFDDAAGVSSSDDQVHTSMERKPLEAEHRSGFADTQNNPDYKGLDSSNMRTVDNDSCKYSPKTL